MIPPFEVKLGKITITPDGVVVEGQPGLDGQAFTLFATSDVIMGVGMSIVAVHDHSYQLTVGSNTFKLISPEES